MNSRLRRIDAPLAAAARPMRLVSPRIGLPGCSTSAVIRPSCPPVERIAFSADIRARGNRDLGPSVHRPAASFDHLIGGSLERQRYRQAQCLCGLEIDDQVELSRELDGKIGRLFALQYP